MSFELSHTVEAHLKSVKCVVEFPLIHNSFITGSSDGLVKIWSLNGDSNKYEVIKTFIGHTDSVDALIFVPANKNKKNGELVSGDYKGNLIKWFLNFIF